MHGLRGFFVTAIAIVCLLVVAARADAQTTSPTTAPSVSISLRAGFDRVARPGGWTPVFVRVDVPDDAAPIDKPVDLLIANPTRGTREDVVRTPVSLAPGAATFTVYLRAGSPIDWPVQVRLVDRATDRTLAEAPRERASDPLIATGFGRLVGVSGDAAVAANAVTQIVRVPNAAPGRLDATLLPDVSLGYECVDVLALAGANASTLSIDQWRAIDEWTRAGGSLLVWLDASPVDPTSPLAELLPATVGPVGLDARGVASRSLVLKSGATPFSVGELTGASARHGLGRVLLLASDPTTTAFSNDLAVAQQWTAILDAATVPRPIDPTDAIVSSMGFVEPKPAWINWRAVAIGAVVAMALLGPVDSLVLWLIRKNPRTWYTTTGWVLLVPAVLFAAYAPTNAPQLPTLHRVTAIDEVDGERVRSAAIIGAASTQPADRDAAVWASAARPSTEPPGLAPRHRFDQTRTGQHEVASREQRPVLVEERNLGPLPAMLEVKSTESGIRVTHLADAPITRLRVVRGDSFWQIDRVLQPDESIDVPLTPADAKRLPALRSPVGFEQRMGVAPRDADDALTALSRVNRPDATVVIAEQGTGEARTYVRAWLFER
jgi:hypothetical protein